MTNLVTGGTGFVGGAIVDQLFAANEKVRVLARPTSEVSRLKALGVEVAYGDVLDPASLQRAMQGIDILYHAAAQYEVWTASPQRMLQTANDGTRNVLEAALSAGVKKVIHTSSAAAFGLPKNQTVSEERSEPGQLIDIYYRSKYESEQLAKSYIPKGLDVVIVNPSNVYGPGDLVKPVGRSILAILRGEIPALWNANFPIVFIDDVARVHLLAAKKSKTGERYLLVERNAEYREFFGKVAELGGVRLPPFMPYGAAWVFAALAEAASALTRRAPLVSMMQLKSGTQGTRFNGSKAEKELGFSYTPVEQGLEKTIAWYREQGLLKT